jgi:circadian clock protein KaiC
MHNTNISKNLLQKAPTGIKGFDEITTGGLPKGRPTLVCGDAGCGKTLFAMEFLVRGAIYFNEPGVFMSFEETENELTTNVSSLGYDLEELSERKLILLEHVHVERSEIEETGEYDLEGLFIRLNMAIDSINAKRVVLDTIESLFAGLPNEAVLRAELRRLFRWLKDKGVTVIITGERGNGSYTRHGLEEYVSDCVIMLDHRVNDQTSTRRLRVVKYRGSSHGTNEYPFLIDNTGFSVLPITSLGLNHTVSSEKISSGISELDKMLDGDGYYRGSSVLVSGTAGTGKSSLAAHFVNATCLCNEKVLYFSFEESQHQIIRNMTSIGINLDQWIKNGLLRFHTTRPTFYGLEMHLTAMYKEINDFKPSVVIIDPLNSFVTANNELEAKAVAMRLVDYLKINNITGLFTSLTTGGGDLERTDIFVSSLIDTWILLRDIELGGERNHGIYILKSRGMAHSNQIREFLITKEGIKLQDVYVGMNGVLTGSARLAQEVREKAEQNLLKQEIEHKTYSIERKRKALDAQIEALKAEFEAEEAETLKLIDYEKTQLEQSLKDRINMSHKRKGDI